MFHFRGWKVLNWFKLLLTKKRCNIFLCMYVFLRFCIFHTLLTFVSWFCRVLILCHSKWFVVFISSINKSFSNERDFCVFHTLKGLGLGCYYGSNSSWSLLRSVLACIHTGRLPNMISQLSPSSSLSARIRFLQSSTKTYQLGQMAHQSLLVPVTVHLGRRIRKRNYHLGHKHVFAPDVYPEV